jgi:hypothetical protein
LIILITESQLTCNKEILLILSDLKYFDIVPGIKLQEDFFQEKKSKATIKNIVWRHIQVKIKGENNAREKLNNF